MKWRKLVVGLMVLSAFSALDPGKLLLPHVISPGVSKVLA